MKKEQYYIAIEQIEKSPRGGVNLKGVFSSALINRNDTVYIYGRDGLKGEKIINSYRFDQKEYEETGYALVSLYIDNASVEEFELGDVMSNVKNSRSVFRENVRLKGLLYTMNHPSNLQDQYILDMISGSPVFLLANIPKKTAQKNPLIFDTDDTLMIHDVKTLDNKRYLTLYTSDNEVVRDSKNKDASLIELSFSQYCDIFVNQRRYTGIAFNPYSDCVIFTREEVSKIVAIAEEIYEGEESLVESLDLVSFEKDFMEFLGKLAKEIEVIKRMWLIQIEDQEELTYLLVVDHLVDDDILFENIMLRSNLEGYLDDINLDIVNNNYALAQELIPEIKPFYINGKSFN